MTEENENIEEEIVEAPEETPEPAAEEAVDEELVGEEPAAEPEVAVEEAPAEEAPAAEETPAEEPAAEADEAPADEALAEEPAAEGAPVEGAPVEAAPVAASPTADAATAETKEKPKRLPRRLRPQKTRPRRAAATGERKAVVRLPKPEHERGRRQERRGVVVSSAMDKTIVVKVELITSHQRYKKVIRRSVKFHAHDEQNAAKVGDVVRIVETRPISATKHWRLAEIVEVAK